MGREIKFRAWFEKKPEWCNQMFYSDEEKPGLGDWFSECELAKIPVTFMQYTTRKDRNGAEIYDGDILKTWMIRRGKMEVYWEAAQVVWRIARWNYGWPDGQGQDLWQWTRKDDKTYECEIIGNIHQNPEMIDG